MQARQLAAALKSVGDDIGKDLGIRSYIMNPVHAFLLSLSDVMLRKPQTLLQSPLVSADVSGNLSLPHPISLALIKLQTKSSRSEGVSYETHVRGEAEVAAAFVTSLRRCSPQEDIFVATPHRIQRQAVKDALARVRVAHSAPEDTLAEDMGKMGLGSDDLPAPRPPGHVTVDTVERLQGRNSCDS